MPISRCASNAGPAALEDTFTDSDGLMVSQTASSMSEDIHIIYMSYIYIKCIKTFIKCLRYLSNLSRLVLSSVYLYNDLTGLKVESLCKLREFKLLFSFSTPTQCNDFTRVKVARIQIAIFLPPAALQHNAMQT